MTDGLKPKHRAAIVAALAAHEKVDSAVLFGSRTMQTHSASSDVDIALFGEGLTWTDLAELSAAMDDVPMAQSVDLVLHRSIDNPALLKHIREHGVEWYRRRVGFNGTLEIEGEHVGIVCAGNSSAKFKTVSLDEIAKLTLSSVDKKTKKGEFNVLLCNYMDVYSRRFIRTDIPFMAATATKREIERCKLRIEDVVITKDSEKHDDIGAPALIREDVKDLVCGYHLAILRPLKDKLHGPYLYYTLQTEEARHQFHSYANGVTRFGLCKDDILRVEIPLPPFPEQRAIAHVLGTLDDKIELNRRMNETLESMARALFKSWFIDFDPVRAKMALKQQTAQAITPPLRGSRQGKGASPPARRWGEIKRQYTQQTLQRSQTLRESRTDAEGLLWHYLRNKQLGGYKFRRQQPIGPYIVDFACLPQKLLIELDGGQHAEQHPYDQKRDAFLRAKGYNILRFWNNEVFENCLGVLERIYETLSASLPNHAPENHSPLEGESQKSSREAKADAVGGTLPTHLPPPAHLRADALGLPTPPQGGSDWTAERARAYLDSMDEEIAALFPDRLVASELGEIPEGWKVTDFGSVSACFDRLRVPLSKRQRKQRQGNVPYYGATSVMDYVDEAIFDGIYLLLGEDGSVLKGDGTPFTQYIWGKSWVNNHAHVLQGRNGISTEQLYLFMKETNIASFVTGAVQLKLNQKNMNSIPFIRAIHKINKYFNDRIGFLFTVYKTNIEVTETLVQLRDLLLPKLISGEIRLREAGKWFEEVV